MLCVCWQIIYWNSDMYYVLCQFGSLMLFICCSHTQHTQTRYSAGPLIDSCFIFGDDKHVPRSAQRGAIAFKWKNLYRCMYIVHTHAHHTGCRTLSLYGLFAVMLSLSRCHFNNNVRLVSGGLHCTDLSLYFALKPITTHKLISDGHSFAQSAIEMPTTCSFKSIASKLSCKPRKKSFIAHFLAQSVEYPVHEWHKYKCVIQFIQRINSISFVLNKLCDYTIYLLFDCFNVGDTERAEWCVCVCASVYYQSDNLFIFLFSNAGDMFERCIICECVCVLWACASLFVTLDTISAYFSTFHFYFILSKPFLFVQFRLQFIFQIYFP